MIIQDDPDNSLYEEMREPVLAVRPSDYPDIDRSCKAFAVFERGNANALTAGVYVYVHPGWAYVDLLWVQKEKRGHGLGKRLMQEAEREARNRGCHSAYLWTQDFEAPAFYEKLGYKKFVTFEDFIPGHQRIGFMKRLAA